MKQKMVALLCVILTTVLVLCSCGGLSTEEKGAAEQNVGAALEKMAEAQSMRGNLYYEYSYSNSWKNYSTAIDMDFKAEDLGSLKKMYAAGSTAMNGESVTMEAYIISNGDGTETRYVCTGDPDNAHDWEISTQEEDASSGDPMGMTNDVLGAGAYGFTAERIEKIGDRSAVKLKGYAGAEQYTSLLAGAVDSLEESDLDGVKLPYTVWLDRENYEVLQLEIDLKDVVELIVRAELEAYGYGDADAKMKSVLFRMRIDETGRSYGITVPEAAQQQANSDDRLSDLIAKMTQGDFYGLQ